MINKLQSPAALPFLQGGRGWVEGAGALGTQRGSKLVPHVLCPEPRPPARIPLFSHAPLFSRVTLHFPPNVLFKASRKTQGVLLQCLRFLPFTFPTAALKNPFYSHELKVLSLTSNYVEIASQKRCILRKKGNRPQCCSGKGKGEKKNKSDLANPPVTLKNNLPGKEEMPLQQ